MILILCISKVYICVYICMCIHTYIYVYIVHYIHIYVCIFLTVPSSEYTIRINYPGESQYWDKIYIECHSHHFIQVLLSPSRRKLLEEVDMQTQNTKKLLVRNKWPQ